MLEWYYFVMENYAVPENSVIQWTYWKQFGVCFAWKYDWNRMKTGYWHTSYTITFERWHFLVTPTEDLCPQARSCERQLSHDHLGSKVIGTFSSVVKHWWGVPMAFDPRWSCDSWRSHDRPCLGARVFGGPCPGGGHIRFWDFYIVKLRY